MIARFLELDGAGLATALEAGHPLRPSDLAGARYRGISLGLPAFVDRLAWKTFEKDFAASSSPTGSVRGWNVRLEQTGWYGPAVPRRVASGEPMVFGHFDVLPRPDGRPGVELDYGSHRNPRFDPVRRLRDPVVALEPGDATWLLGCSDVVVAGRRLRTPSYFLLERLGPLT